MESSKPNNPKGANGDRTQKIKSKLWRVVLNCPPVADDSTPIENLKRLIAKFQEFAPVAQMQYACILHDRDLKEDGSAKTPHIHFVIWDSVASSKKGFIHLLSEGLGVPDNVITADPCPRVAMAVQYLIHMNAPTKAQYLENEIVTNCKKKVSQLLYIDLMGENNFCRLSDKQILGLVKDGISYSGLISIVGIQQAKEWATSFTLLKEELRRGVFHDDCTYNYKDI